MATILVVDDTAIIRDPLAAILKLAGHATLIAGNGQEALGIIEGNQVDLVLLDLAMPVMDGLNFLDRLRAHPHTEATAKGFRHYSEEYPRKGYVPRLSETKI